MELDVRLIFVFLLFLLRFLPYVYITLPQFSDFSDDFGEKVDGLAEGSLRLYVVLHQKHVALLASGDGNAVLFKIVYAWLTNWLV